MVSTKLLNALKSLDYPVERLFYIGSSKTFFTFQTINIKPSNFYDDDNSSYLYTFRVNLFTKNNFETLLKSTIETLKINGFTILNVDAEIFENDTKYYNIPITIEINEEV